MLIPGLGSVTDRVHWTVFPEDEHESHGAFQNSPPGAEKELLNESQLNVGDVVFSFPHKSCFLYTLITNQHTVSIPATISSLTIRTKWSSGFSLNSNGFALHSKQVLPPFIIPASPPQTHHLMAVF